MDAMRLKYGTQQFTTLDDMVTTLLHEINEQIVRIDMGLLPNGVDERNEAKFRLMHLQRQFHLVVPEQYRSNYNSLWSQLYRLEHQDHFKNPYLKQVYQWLERGE